MLKDSLKKIREDHGLTKRELCEKTGISERAYLTYEFGEREPKISVIQKLADFYGVTTDYLLGREPAKSPLDQLHIAEDEKSVLTGYLTLPSGVRAQILDTMLMLAQRASEARKRVQDDAPPLFVFKRLSVHKASAGVGYDLYDPDAWREVTVLDCPEAHDADFAVQIEGDSMEPSLHDGDIVYVRIDPEVPVGKVGVFQVDGCGYIKERGTDRLISHNPAYPPIPLAGTESRCIGLVIGVAELPGKCGK